MATQDPRLPPELEVDFMLAEATGGEREAIYRALVKVFEELAAVCRELRVARVSETGLPGHQMISYFFPFLVARIEARRAGHERSEAFEILERARRRFFHGEVPQLEHVPQLAFWEESTWRDVQSFWQEGTSQP